MKSVKLHFSVCSNIKEFLKVIRFLGALEISTLEVEKYRFKQKSEN